jgi:hypothetical protein
MISFNTAGDISVRSNSYSNSGGFKLYSEQPTREEFLEYVDPEPETRITTFTGLGVTLYRMMGTKIECIWYKHMIGVWEFSEYDIAVEFQTNLTDAIALEDLVVNYGYWNGLHYKPHFIPMLATEDFGIIRAALHNLVVYSVQWPRAAFTTINTTYRSWHTSTTGNTFLGNVA